MLKLPEEILLHPILKKENGILFTQIPKDTFENAYIRLRKKEGWFYTGLQLQQLPDVSTSDLHYALWQIRKKSTNRLVKYLKANRNIHNILDVGCGNGWLTNKLAEAIPDAQVIGIDINATELKLAAHTFSTSNILWLYGDVLKNIFKQNSFDLIILSASIQYFPDVKNLMHFLLQYMKPGGEIHILDSPLYAQAESAKAAERSADYYLKSGVPEMQSFYFHHTVKSLQQFNIQIKYKPGIIKMVCMQFFTQAYVPFPWVIVHK